MAPSGPARPPPGEVLVASAAVFYLFMVLLALALGWWQALALPSWTLHPVGLAVAVGSAALLVLASRLLVPRAAWARAMAEEFRETLGPLRPGEVLALALLSGVAEEVLFRGVLQPWLGPLAATLLFGLVHLPYKPSLRPWTLFALLVGAWLAFLTDWTGSLLAPAAFHVLVNAGNLGWIVSMERGRCPSSAPGPPPSESA